MKKQQTAIYITFFVLLLAGITYYFSQEKHKHNWKESYANKPEEPYETGVLHHLLEKYTGGQPFIPIERRLAKALPTYVKNTNYIFVGEAMEVAASDQDSLLAFVKNGNTAFLATKRLPDELVKTVLATACGRAVKWDWLGAKYDSIVQISLKNVTPKDSSFQFNYKYAADTTFYPWHFIDASYFRDSMPRPTSEKEAELVESDTQNVPYFLKDSLSTQEKAVFDSLAQTTFALQDSLEALADSLDMATLEAEEEAANRLPAQDTCAKRLIALGFVDTTYVNFCKIQYGEGTFFFHTNPIVFTNYHISDARRRLYAQRVLSHLPETSIYWDVANRTSIARVMQQNDNRNSHGFNKNSPLKYILAQPPLAWAWYILVGMGILYAIFYSKRRQRVVPVLLPIKNTSVEFIKTIGRLNHQQGNHGEVARQIWRDFSIHIKEKFNMNTNTINENWIETLAAKSGAPKALIEKLTNFNAYLSKVGGITEQELIDFHADMHVFYQNLSS